MIWVLSVSLAVRAAWVDPRVEQLMTADSGRAFSIGGGVLAWRVDETDGNLLVWVSLAAASCSQ